MLQDADVKRVSTPARIDGNNREIQVLFDVDRIAARIEELAREINKSFERDIFVVAILKGSFVFTADLLRALHRAGTEPEVDFMTLQSYHDDTVSSGQVRILRDVERDMRGRDVLIVDDILESGRTLHFAREHIMEKGAASTRTCVLLDKPVARAPGVPDNFQPDIKAFDCPDVFVIGYGMDLANRYRELPFIGELV